VNWLPVTCIPSPESPAKRMTACSITSRLDLLEGTSVSVDIVVRDPRRSASPLPTGRSEPLENGRHGFKVERTPDRQEPAK
jgi:hypothetical protein